MPRYLDRHARSSEDGWGSEPSRSQQRQAAAADDPAKRRAPGRKNPDLCKAAHWKEPHKAELKMRQYPWQRKVTCRWGTSYLDNGKPVWHCLHEEVCAGCGKVLRISIGKQECPQYHPVTREELAGIEADYAERRRRVEASRRRVRPVITGPTGYRKKRA